MEFNTQKNQLYFGGITSGLESTSNIPASGNYDNSYNGGTNDFFVARMDTNQTFVNSTYIGGSNNEVNMMGLNVDLNNDVYIFGYSNSANFPVTSDALQSLLNNTSSNGSSPDNDKVFFKLPADLAGSPLYSTYYGGSVDDYDPVGERGIKFSNCRIYTIVTAESNNIPLTQGAVTTSKLSSTSIYEPGLVVWANPPDLLNNTISGNQTICAGATPTGLSGSVPNYSLATISRNGTTSAYPASLPSATTYTWQSSTDSTNWTNIPGGNTQNLAPALMGSLQQKTFYRRIIGGDACVIAGAADQSVTVKVLSVPAEVSPISCYGLSDGKIKATPDGTPPYQYTWKKQGSNTVISTSQTISNLGLGTYEITVIDASNCSASNSFTITQPAAPLSATASSTNATCGSNNGTATASPAGGTAPYTYEWSNGGSTATITGVGAGFLSVIVKDANMCQTSANTAVNNVSNLTAGTSSVTHVDCYGNSTGSFTAAGSNGVQPYSYSFNGGNFQASGTFGGLAPGNYPVSVKDNVGCIANMFVQINQPSAPLAASLGGKTDAACADEASGSATVNVSGGTAPYSFTWSPSGGSSSTANGLLPGTYTVTIKDANQCTVNPIQVNILNTDATKPEWNTVAGSLDRSVACDNAAALADAQLLKPQATDNCSITYVKTSGSFVAGTCGATGTYTNSWIAKDAAGNQSAPFTQVITVTDQISPTWTSAAGSLDKTISCDDDGELRRLQSLSPVATDNCGSVSLTKTTGDFVAGNCGGSYTNTWVAKDACNNASAVFTQVITITDLIKPVISICAEPKSIQTNANCKALVPDFTAGVSVKDNCTPNSRLVVSQSPAAGTEVGPGTINVVISVKDACGNEETCSTSLHVTGIIDAVNDAGTSVNGYAGGTSVSDVLVNDKLNCGPATTSTVTISQKASDNPGVSLQGKSVLVAPGTPAGNYTLSYQICEIENPSNCDEATVTVPVSAAPIDAVDDNGTMVNGFEGGISFSNVLGNDKLNGNAVIPAEVTISFVGSSAPEISLAGTDVHVAAGTPSGNYTLTYKICEILNPTNCDQATVTVPVKAAEIDARDDAGEEVNGFTGGTSFSNVLSNDLLNGTAVSASDVEISFVSSTNPGISLSGIDVVVAAGTASGTYSLVYKICEKLNPDNCDQATVSVKVVAPSIQANNDAGGQVNGFEGGTSFVNVLGNDLLNGSPVDPAKVNISFVSATNPGVSLSGKNVVVAPGTTSGNYTLTYKICEIINPANCDEATVSVPVSAEAPVALKGEIAPCYPGVAEAEAAAIAATSVTPGNCAGDVNKTARTSGTCEAVITVTVSDNCGNSGDIVYQTRIDNQGPQWSTSEDALNRKVSCNDPAGLAAAQALSPVATDNCAGEVTYTFSAGSFVAGTCGTSGSYTNTWVAKDACGNTSSLYTQVISVVDEKAPEWTSAAGSLNRSVSCDNQAGLDAAQALEPAAGDNCGSDIKITKQAGSFSSNGCGGTYTNIFTATDACENTSVEFVQVITITDEKAPEWITSAGAIDEVVSCEDASALAAAQALSPEAQDNCSGVTYVKTAGEFVAGNCGSAGSYTNTWVASDACKNNSTVYTQVIQVTDKIAPEITACSESKTVTASASCKALVPDFTSGVIANDNCTAVQSLLITQEPATGSEVGPGITEIVITVSDACGNKSQCISNLVVKSVIDAVNDNGTTVNGYTGGTSLVDVLVNDKLNCSDASYSDVHMSQISSSHPGISLSGTSVLVTPGTPAGAYKLVYQICEKANPSVCDQAEVSVQVSAAEIVANDDAGSSVNGFSGGVSFSNVLINDKLNGVMVQPGEVLTSFVSSSHPGITLSNTSVLVAPGTPSGNYSLRYKICEVLNPDNCDEATVTVPVGAAPIDAVDDNGTTVNGFTGGVGFSNILANDKLNAIEVNPADVTLSFVSASAPGISLAGTDVQVAAGTPAGSYTLRYRICELLNPENCDEANVVVGVVAAEIDARNDAGDEINGLTGGTSFVNVLSNDLLNGVPVSPSDINLSFVSSGNPGISLNGANVVVAAGTPAGSYDLVYKICEKLNPDNCDQATVSVKVTEPVIDAINDEGGMVNGFSGGTSFVNVLWNDQLNGMPVDPGMVSISFVSSTHAGVSLSGKNVVVAPGTPTGNYSLTYKICELLNPENCDQANVTVPVSAEAPVASKGEIAPCYTTRSAAEAAALAATTVIPGNCGGDISKTATVTEGCSAVISVKVSDACGNFTTITYHTRIDNQGPRWNTAANALNRKVSCNDPEALAAARELSPVAVDNCPGNVGYTYSAGSFVPGSCGASGTYTNTWVANDACGNTSSIYTQVISVVDEKAPEWISMAGSLNRSVSCDDPAGLASAQALEPLAQDNCDADLVITKKSGSLVSNGCGGTYTNTFTATDACKNESALFTQVITITDEQAPEWLTTAGTLDVTIEVNDGQALNAAQQMAPEARDHCSEVSYVVTRGDFIPGTCGGTYTNTWIPKDKCNNPGPVFTQVIRVNDTGKPEWITEAGALNRTVECENSDELKAALRLEPKARDNSGSAEVKLVSEQKVSIPGGAIYTRTWIANDACSNESIVYQQEVKVFDATTPVLSEAGPNMIITCPEQPVFTPPTATDNCDPNPRVEILCTNRTPVNQNSGIYSLTRKWIAYDASGNSSGERSQTITVKPVETTITKTICQGSSFQFYGNTYASEGVYKVVISNNNGCYELIRLILHVNTPSTAAVAVNASSGSVIPGASVALSVSGGSLGTAADWKWYKGGCGSGEPVGSGPSIVVSPTEPTTYFVRAEGSCGITACVSKTIDIERTSSCSAHAVVAFSQGKRKDYGNVPALRSNPEQALGTPQYNDNANAPVNYVSLGFGGELILKFQYPIANGAGNDLRVVETSYGNPACNTYREKIRVYVSQDGLSWQLAGEGCQNADFDLETAGLPWAMFVKLKDASSRSDFSAGDADGYDVDGIECLNGNADISLCAAAKVVETRQGKTKANLPVPVIRSNPANALGEPEPVVNGVVNFYSLGFGGEMTVEFDGAIANGPGPDVRIAEATWDGKVCANYPESADVFASQDGVQFIYLGQACHSQSFDLGKLSWAKYIRIADHTDPSSFPSDADGYDVNGVVCLNGSTTNLKDDGLSGCSLQGVISYDPGTRKDGAAVIAERRHPEKALGIPENNQTMNFVSLGFGGTLIVGFDYVVFNRPGNDLKVVETSYGNPLCNNYPENAEISGSMDLVSWEILDTICLDGQMDLGKMKYAQFFRIRDISDKSSNKFIGTDDGFDVDGIVSLHDGCEAIGARVSETREATEEMPTLQKEEIFVEIYPNPTAGNARISFKGLQRSTSYSLTLFDASGRLLKREKIAVDAARNYYELETGNLPPGVLLVLINGDNERYVQRLIKK